jgi:hypothetical protein
MLKNGMKQYEFKAHDTNVDFRRMLRENPDADFIKVQWTPQGESRPTGIVLVSERGARRMAAVGLPIPSRFLDLGLNRSGNDWRAGPMGDPVYVITAIQYGDKVIASLKHQEAEKHRILASPNQVAKVIK